MLLMSERLNGYDTFLKAKLQLNAGGLPLVVRVLTMDDLTALHVLEREPTSLFGRWSGILHLPPGWGTPSVPEDMLIAAEAAGRDLSALGQAELRYAITFVGEAISEEVRSARIAVVLQALPQVGPVR